MKRLLCMSAALGVAATLSFAGPALAHGHRDVAGHEFTVGWANEPAFVGQPNAVQLIVAEHGGGPVEGLEDDLSVEVSLGGVTTDPLTLRTVFDSPGEYRADLIPTVVGGYTFRFSGELDGVKIDESFTSPKDGFDEVEGTSEIAFPKQAPTTSELAEKLASVQTQAADAKDAVALPRILAIAGVVLGVVAIGLVLRPRRSA